MSVVVAEEVALQWDTHQNGDMVVVVVVIEEGGMVAALGTKDGMVVKDEATAPTCLLPKSMVIFLTSNEIKLSSIENNGMTLLI